MTGFKSDAQRKHFFANHGGGGGGSLPSFPDFGSAFNDMNMEQSEKQYAEMWSESDQFLKRSDTGGANVDGPAAGGRNPMPVMSAEESAQWRKGIGKF